MAWCRYAEESLPIRPHILPEPQIKYYAPQIVSIQLQSLSASLLQMRTIIYPSSQEQCCENKIMNIHETFIYSYQGLEMWNK